MISICKVVSDVPVRLRCRWAYVCTVACTDDETAVENELHVAGTAGLSTGSRDVLADIRGRADDLGFADVVVLDEDDLEQVTNIRVVVDHTANFTDEMDHSLGHPVARRSLATEDVDARGNLLALLSAHLLDGQVAVDDTENVELLALVLVYTLHLYVEQRGRVHTNTGGFLDVLGQADLVRILDFLKLLSEVFVVDVVLDLVKESKVLQELVAAKLRCNQFGQSGVGLMQPTTRGDTVGDVGELVRPKDSDEVLEDRRLDEVRVQFGDTVDLVRTDNSQVSHADHLWVGLLNDRYTSKHLAILGEVALHVLKEVHVDVVDDLEVTGQKVLDQRNGPLLKCFRQDSVVGVAKRLLNN